MPFTLIKGTFQPTFGFPDGDSIRFVPDDSSPIFRLKRRGFAPKINPNNGSIQLRYEAIDTMEKRALDPYASDATAANLDFVGTNGGVNPAPGYIFSNQLGPSGRPISFVFSGTTSLNDGSDDNFLSADAIEGSVNFQLARQGNAYPLFYDTLFRDLRDRFTTASQEAKAENLGVWKADVTNAGATWTGDVKSLAPVYPKLWRRIDTYTRDETFFDANKPFANLKPWMEQKRDERTFNLADGAFTGFDNLVETTDHTVKLTAAPHEMIVVSS